MAQGSASASPHPMEVDFLAGGGEMAELVKTKDWSTTPLGPIETWPQSLRTTVSLCLTSNFPINIIWGAEHAQIYNDGYRVVCGEAHPAALGQSYAVTWESAWPAIGGPFEQARAGQTSFLENQRMFLTRNGYLEETFFTFSLSPIRDESGGIGGLFHPVTETTATLLAERRTRAVRDLTTGLGGVSDPADFAAVTIDSLSAHAFDLPFLLIYELDAAGDAYGLTTRHAVDAGLGGTPSVLALDADAPWPVAAAISSGSLTEVVDIRRLMSGGLCGPYEEAPDRAMILPVTVPGVAVPPILVVAGVSPRLPFDDAYRGLYELISAALSAALGTIRAREDERRRAEALSELDRAKTQFFANVSHEFRTPLTLMLAPLEESLAQSDRLPSDEVERLTLAHRNAQRLLRLVNSLLDFSRVEAGRVEAAFEATDIAAYTAELASNFRSATDKAGLDLIIQANPLDRPVYLEREMWEKIVFNLLSNAFKFTLSGSITVIVRASADGDHAVLVVGDTGTGIPAADLPRLFERFYRVENAQGRSFEGSGIGLALVHELVKMHGGSIEVASRLGRGTVFTVTLPMAPEPIAVASAPAASTTRGKIFVDEALQWLPAAVAPPIAGSTSAGRIVLADDNSDMLAYVQRLLTVEGFAVEAVADGEAALAAARREPPDLVLSDVMMPKLDGFELLQAMRSDPRLREIPIILLSARAGEEARIEGVKAGADDYLVKPFAARELVARVSASLRLVRDRREAILRENAERLMALNADLERQVIARSMARGVTWQLSPDLLGVLDGDGHFETSNPAWLTTLGWSEAEVAEKVFFDFIHPDDLERTHQVWEAAIQRGEPAIRFENRYRAKDGDYHWLSWVAVPDGGKVYCSAREITAEKAREDALSLAQDALRQAQKMEAVGQLTGGIAHDFNNMLAVVLGSLELLGRRLDSGDARSKRYVDAATDGARRAAVLTQRLLAFSRQQPLRPEAVDINKLVAGMSDLLAHALGGDVRLETVIAGGLWRSHVDPNQLENVILNLAVNARDAMSGGGKVTIETQNAHLDERYAAAHIGVPPGQFVLIAVSDTGRGMTDDVIAKAFDPFFTTKEVGKGTGLGLSQVYGFVKQSGGHVKIYSELGEGTSVKVYLPRHHGPSIDAVQSQQAEDPPLGDRRETILVVEDEPSVRQFTVDALTELNYRVVQAEGAAAALRLIEAHPEISLLFTDVIMPETNGRKLADEARKRRPDLKVLFTTGYSRNAVVHNGVLDAGVELIGKPFSIEDLAIKVRTMLDADTV